MAWSVDTLAAELLGEMNESRDAYATAPERLENICRQALKHVWYCGDWPFRHRAGTLSVTSGDSDADLPYDFSKLDTRTMRDNSKLYRDIVFTELADVWQAVADQYGDTDTGQPVAALITRDTAATTRMTFHVLLTPTSDATYSYAFPYLCLCPVDLPDDHDDYAADSDVIIMPEPYHELWYSRAAFRAKRAFGKKDWQEDRAEYRDDLESLVAENKSLYTRATEAFADGYEDLSCTLGDAAYEASVRRRLGL